MSDIIIAIYENGVLRPLNTLNLREHQTVRIQVLSEEPIREAEEAIQAMIEAGLMKPPKQLDTLSPDPVSEAERRDLAKKLGQAPGKPLSEIILEDRGEL